MGLTPFDPDFAAAWPGLSQPSCSSQQDVDARHKAGHDEKLACGRDC
jgi:hypothetical protein